VVAATVAMVLAKSDFISILQKGGRILTNSLPS